MNERIKKLAEQAREKKFDYRAREGESHYIYVLNEEKFAELIVRECAKVACKLEQDDTDFRHVSTAIEEHFGVE
jgi:hypothetical protein